MGRGLMLTYRDTCCAHACVRVWFEHSALHLLRLWRADDGLRDDDRHRLRHGVLRGKRARRRRALGDGDALGDDIEDPPGVLGKVQS